MSLSLTDVAMGMTTTPARIRCGVCGRKHEPRLCTDQPKSADDWRHVNAARRAITQR